jgi:hypothetical protein
VRAAVEDRFAPAHRDVVLAELAGLRAAWYPAGATTGTDPEQAIRLAVRAQLDAIEQSGGDPAYFTEKRYRESDDGRNLDRDRLHVRDRMVQDRQLRAKDVASLVEMLSAPATRFDALSALERKGEAAVVAVPRLIELLRDGDQLECAKVLRTLAGIGPPARGAVPALAELPTMPITWSACTPGRR